MHHSIAVCSLCYSLMLFFLLVKQNGAIEESLRELDSLQQCTLQLDPPQLDRERERERETCVKPEQLGGHGTDLRNEWRFLGHQTTIFLLQNCLLQMTQNPNGSCATKGKRGYRSGTVFFPWTRLEISTSSARDGAAAGVLMMSLWLESPTPLFSPSSILPTTLFFLGFAKPTVVGDLPI